MKPSPRFLLASGLVLGLSAGVQAVTVTASQPDLDRWNYPFNANPGTRTSASTFGAEVGSTGFDNRDGQFLLGFDTAAMGIAPGQGAERYTLNAVTVTATPFSDNVFAYDSTYDSYRTYLGSDDPDKQADTDAGRPIELHGIGFRGGYGALNVSGADDDDATTFEPGDPFGDHGDTPGAPDRRDRNVYPVAFDASGGGVDVSNNVSDGFEADPWAIGVHGDLSEGESVPADTTFAFDVNLADRDVRAYLRDGLDQGQLGFAITSLHAATFGGSASYPQFHTNESFDGTPATLTLDYTLVPEPASLALLGLGSAAMLMRRWRRGAPAAR